MNTKHFKVIILEGETTRLTIVTAKSADEAVKLAKPAEGATVVVQVLETIFMGGKAA